MPVKFRGFFFFFFFLIFPMDNLYALPVLLDYITKRRIEDLVVVSPDAGGVERARTFYEASAGQSRHHR